MAVWTQILRHFKVKDIILFTCGATLLSLNFFITRTTLVADHSADTNKPQKHNYTPLLVMLILHIKHYIWIFGTVHRLHHGPLLQ